VAAKPRAGCIASSSGKGWAGRFTRVPSPPRTRVRG
jgi:hypothetical protein